MGVLIDLILKQLNESQEILESPIAATGDANLTQVRPIKIGFPRKEQYLKDWAIFFKQTINGVKYYWTLFNGTKQTVEILTDDPTDNERFQVIGYVELLRAYSIEYLKRFYKPLYQVSKIHIEPRFRKRGLGKLTYILMLEKLKYNLMSDMIQYDGARAIYSKLSKFKTIYCDLIDFDKKEILNQDVEVFQNEKDFWDFDTSVRSWDQSKSNIRIILYIK